MTMPSDTHYLYYSDEIVINWSANVEEIEVRNTRLFNKSSGKPTYLLCSKGCLRGGLFAVRYDSSLTLYYDLLKMCRAKE